MWCHRLSGLSRGPCLTHDTEKASPAAAASISPTRQLPPAQLSFQLGLTSISGPFKALTFASWKHRVKPLISRAGVRACGRAPRKPIHAFTALIEFPRRPARITSRPRVTWAEARADDASFFQSVSRLFQWVEAERPDVQGLKVQARWQPRPVTELGFFLIPCCREGKKRREVVSGSDRHDAAA